MSGRWRSATWIPCNSSWRWAARVRARLRRSRRVNQAPYSREHVFEPFWDPRTVTGSDRRVNRIVITDAGHRLYAQIKDEAATVRQQFLAGIDLQSLAHLTELLEQLQCILKPYRDWAPVRLNCHETLDEI